MDAIVLAIVVEGPYNAQLVITTLIGTYVSTYVVYAHHLSMHLLFLNAIDNCFVKINIFNLFRTSIEPVSKVTCYREQTYKIMEWFTNMQYFLPLVIVHE